MKSFFYLLLSMIGIILVSCDQENQENIGESKINVQLNPTFITLDEGSNKPMRSISEFGETDNTIYAIQIYENDVEYYYGLFDNVSDMQIALTTSKNYKFKIFSYKQGTGKGLKTITDTAGVNYFLPSKIPLKNIFIKGNLLKDIDLTSSIILNGEQKDYPEIDGFYATKTVTLEKGTTAIDFALLRMGFGLYLNVDALTLGNMEVYIGNDTIKLNNNKTSATTVRLFDIQNGNFTNIHSKSDTYGDSILLKVKWTNTNGTSVNAQGMYYFSRNYQKTVNIQLNTLTNDLSFEGWKFLKDGLVAWYPFNGNANDESGNGKNGTVFGAALTTDRLGNANSAYVFNGTSDYILTNFFGPTGSAERTISFWAQPTTSNSKGSAILHSGGANTGNIWGRGFSITFIYNAATIMTDIGDATKNYSNNSILNSWNFYTIVVPKMISPQLTDVLMYLNGKLLTDFTYFNGTKHNMDTGNLEPLNIGRAPTYSTTYGYQSFKGKIDNIGIWDRALTQDEITALYNEE